MTNKQLLPSSLKNKSSHPISEAVKSKILNPRLKYLTIHPRLAQHHHDTQLGLSHLTPSWRDSFLDTKAIVAYLNGNPPIVIKSGKNQWLVVTKLLSIHLARLCLHENDKIRVIALESLTDDQIDQMLVMDYVITPIVNRSIMEVGTVWSFKQHLEKNGILAKSGIKDMAKKNWASLLGCDYRRLSD